MAKNFLKVLGASALLAAAFSVSAFAADITSVSFECGADTDASISAGVTSPVFAVNDANAQYEMTSYEEANDSSTAFKTARVYTLNFVANDGYSFPNASNITVTGKGITAVTSKKTESDGDVLVVKVKAYPYYCWDAPEWQSGEGELSDGETKKVTFKKPTGSPTIEYILTWVDQKGEQHNTSGTTSNSYITISSYNKKLSASQEKSNEKGDTEYTPSYVQGIALRAKGNAGENTRTAPSSWSAAVLGSVNEGDFDVSDYDNWGDLFDGVQSVHSSGGSSSSGGSYGPGKGSASLNGWSGSDANGWYFYQNGALVKGWKWDGSNWYYLDPTTGRMKTGWVVDNGASYYLNPNAGGPMGAMLTGTHVIDGQTITFAANGARQ